MAKLTVQQLCDYINSNNPKIGMNGVMYQADCVIRVEPNNNGAEICKPTSAIRIASADPYSCRFLTKEDHESRYCPTQGTPAQLWIYSAQHVYNSATSQDKQIMMDIFNAGVRL